MEGWQTQVVAAPSMEAAQRLQVTILLPAYNEAEAIGRVLEEIVETLSESSHLAPRDELWPTCSASRRQLAERIAHIPPRLAERVAHTPLEFEILVVDDASTDGTAEVVEAFAAECWQCALRLIRCPENRGAGAARKVGIRAARGEIIVMLDADGTYPAAAIPELLRHFPAFDQVNGARTAERGTLPWLRAAAKWAIRKLACYLTGKHIPDLNTGLKAFRRDAMLPWLWVVPDGFSCVTTMTLAFLTNGYAVKYVPIEYRRRIGRSKFHIVRDTLSYLSTVIRIVLYFRPLKVFGPLAGLVLVAGAAKSVWSLRTTGSMQESDIVVLVAGFMTLMLGMLAEVIVAHHRR